MANVDRFWAGRGGQVRRTLRTIKINYHYDDCDRLSQSPGDDYRFSWEIDGHSLELSSKHFCDQHHHVGRKSHQHDHHH